MGVAEGAVAGKHRQRAVGRSAHQHRGQGRRPVGVGVVEQNAGLRRIEHRLGAALGHRQAVRIGHRRVVHARGAIQLRGDRIDMRLRDRVQFWAEGAAALRCAFRPVADAERGEGVPDQALVTGAGGRLQNSVAHVFHRRACRREVHAADEIVVQRVLGNRVGLEQFPQAPDRRGINLAVEVNAAATHIAIGAWIIRVGRAADADGIAE